MLYVGSGGAILEIDLESLTAAHKENFLEQIAKGDLTPYVPPVPVKKLVGRG